MKGGDWVKAFEKKPTNILIEIKNALEILESDPDINREFRDSGLFYGLGNLKNFSEEEIRRRNDRKGN